MFNSKTDHRRRSYADRRLDIDRPTPPSATRSRSIEVMAAAVAQNRRGKKKNTNDVVSGFRPQ